MRTESTYFILVDDFYGLQNETEIQQTDIAHLLIPDGESHDNFQLHKSFHFYGRLMIIYKKVKLFIGAFTGSRHNKSGKCFG